MTEAVAAYKRMLAAIIEKRPSGTRQRLAGALAKNRSFVSQITNPAYATPIPASHLAQIFEICHFSAAERQEFVRLYGLAHPKKILANASAGNIRRASSRSGRCRAQQKTARAGQRLRAGLGKADR